MLKIAPSILSSKDRVLDIKKLNETDIEYVHIDVMDNKFVPNYQLPANEVNQLSKISNKKFDIHLMVEDPLEYMNELTCNNIYNITFHVEINKDLDELITIIKNKGYNVGIAINPKTEIERLDKYLNKVDMVLIMSVEPGFGGQKFIDSTIDKIKYIRVHAPEVLIEVDGGINLETIDKVKYITDFVVAGSYITNSEDFQKAIDNLKN